MRYIRRVLIKHRDNGHKRGEGAGAAGDYRVHGVYAWGKGAWAFSYIDEWGWRQRDLFGALSAAGTGGRFPLTQLDQVLCPF
jgi:hypothetical protein